MDSASEAAIATDTGEPVQYSLTAGLATITLNRPDKLNSLNAAMHERLRALLTDIGSNPDVRALLIAAKGRAFCAGQDLNERRSDSGQSRPDLGLTLEKNWNPLARALRYIRVPTVCAVNGVAAGAGVSIALACDLVIAARSASFVLSFSRLGLIPDAGATYLLPRLVGEARAMGIALLGDKVSAEEAASVGMIWRQVDDDDLPSYAQQIAHRLAQGPTLGLSMIKRAIKSSSANSFEDQLELERSCQRQCGFSDDYREGVMAFIEKREPDYKGR